MQTGYRQAAAIVAVTSTMLVLGALAFQAIGYAPCEMCMWQRWLHVGAATAGGACALWSRTPRRPLAWCAILLLALSGATGAFHAGVEAGLWTGPTTCSAPPHVGSGDILAELARAPAVRCDQAAWTLLGISMAGYNAILSLGIALAAAVFMRRRHGSQRDEEREGRQTTCT